MSPTVIDFSWTFCLFDFRDDRRVLDTIETVLVYMPHLTSLSLTTTSYFSEDAEQSDRQFIFSEYEDNLGQLFSHLCSLRTVKFSPYMLSPKIIQYLQHLPFLSQIVIDRRGIRPRESTRHHSLSWLEPACTTLIQPAFPSLTDFSVCLPELSVAQSLLRPGNFPMASLCRVELAIAFPLAGRANLRCLYDFLCRLVKDSPALTDVHLDLTKRCLTVDDLEGVPSIGFRTLAPIVEFPMERFSIRDTRSLRLSDANIDNIARHWPNLESISLNPRPHKVAGSHLSLRAIASFAKWCPLLRRLGIHLSGWSPVTSMYSRLPTFSPCFKELDLGTSPFPVHKGQDLPIRLTKNLVVLVPLSAKFCCGPHEISDSNTCVLARGPADKSLDPNLALQQYEMGWRAAWEQSRVFLTLYQEFSIPWECMDDRATDLVYDTDSDCDMGSEDSDMDDAEHELHCYDTDEDEWFERLDVAVI